MLKEPQMPLYSLTHDDCDGLRYVLIHDRKKAEKTGIRSQFVQSTADGELATSTTAKFPANSFDELRTQWREVMTKTVEDFHDGVARVEPINSKICEQCQLEGLCRIFKLNVFPADLSGD